MTSGAAAALVLVLVAACGGPAATPSSSPSPEPVPTTAPTEAPSASPEPSAAAEPQRLLAACEGVAIRAKPERDADVLARVAKLTKVRVAETVKGEAYTTGSCGTSGNEWLKIDRVNGTSVKKLYGVKFAYAAAGLFE